jgi:hypothetical protein
MGSSGLRIKIQISLLLVMKHTEFYSKHRATYPPIVNPVFSRRNWWRIALITIAAVLIEPLIMYKYNRSSPLSFSYYVKLLEYILFIIVPFVVFLLWINWRESTKRSRGYCWIGKFEVLRKQSTFAFRYLFLSPGDSNKLKVNRSLFQKTRVGDFILIRRDAFGMIEEINKVNNFSSRLARAGTKRPKGD